MKRCDGFEDMISAFIDGVLADKDRLELMEHMAHCSACQNYFNEQIAIHDALMDDAETIQPPIAFTETVMEQVRSTPQKRKKLLTLRWQQWQRWTAFAACCLLAALGVWRLADITKPTSTEMAMTSRSIGEEESAEEPAFDAGGAATVTRQTTDTSSMGTGYSNDMPAEPESVTDSEPSLDLDKAESESVTDSEPSLDREKALPSVQQAVSGAKQLDQEPALAYTPSNDTAPSVASDPATFEPQTDNLYAGILTTSSPLAAAWAADHLDAAWIEGACYELNAEEYHTLRDVLTEGGAVFEEQTGPSGESEGFLLIAADAAETD